MKEGEKEEPIEQYNIIVERERESSAGNSLTLGR